VRGVNSAGASAKRFARQIPSRAASVNGLRELVLSRCRDSVDITGTTSASAVKGAMRGNSEIDQNVHA
jgi:hypothetical protein